MTAVEAYVLVNCEAGKAWEIVEATLEMENVKAAHTVTGLYDIIIYIEFADMEALTDILNKLQMIAGVQKTHTAVAISSKLK